MQFPQELVTGAKTKDNNNRKKEMIIIQAGQGQSTASIESIILTPNIYYNWNTKFEQIDCTFIDDKRGTIVKVIVTSVHILGNAKDRFTNFKPFKY